MRMNTVWVILGIPGVSGEEKAVINLVIIVSRSQFQLLHRKPFKSS